MSNHCPNCGASLNVEITARGGAIHRLGRRVLGQKRQTFQSAVPGLPQHGQPGPDLGSLQPGFSFHREYAQFPRTMENDVQVPLWSAILTGGFLMLATCTSITTVLYAIVPIFSPVIYASWRVRVNIGFWDALSLGTAIAIIAGSATIYYTWKEELKKSEEMPWRTDEVHQGGASEPQSSPNIQVHELRTGKTWRYAFLPHDPSDPGSLHRFIAAYLSSEVSFSESGAEQVGYPVRLYRQLRDDLIAANICYWKDEKNKRAGVDFTVSGKQFLRSLVNNPPPDDYDPHEEEVAGMSSHYIDKGTKKGSWANYG